MLPQEHLLSFYLPLSSEPLFETMIDGTLWFLIQATCLAWGMAGVAIAERAWTFYRMGTQGKKNEI